MSSIPSSGAVLRSEVVALRRSPVLHLAWGAVFFGVLSAILALGTVADPDWSTLLAYQNMWVVAFGPLFLALIVGTHAHLDRSSRGGGTWYRPVAPWSRRLARFAVLSPLVLLVNVLALLAPVLAGVLLVGGAPVAHLLGSTVVPVLGQLGLLAVLVRVGAGTGRTAVLVVGLVWSVVAVLTAESSVWAFSPPAWTVRGSLPVIGTHANGEALLPGEALADASVTVSLLLSLALAVIVLAFPASLGRVGVERGGARRRPRSSREGQRVRVPGRPRGRAGARPVRAVLVVLRRTPILPLAAAAVCMPAVLLRWRDPTEAIGAHTLAVIPIGAVVLAVLVRSAMVDGIRATATRVPDAGVQWRSAAVVGAVTAAAVVVATGIVFVGAGLPVLDALRTVGVGMVVATMLTTVHLWCAVRFSVAVTIAVGIAGTVTALLVGGTEMQELWWPLTPWSWAHYAQASRVVVIVPVAVSVTVVGWTLLARAGRRESV
ncbi:hypothetical protein ACFU8R_20230 [Pseudonocardia alni]|uniref:hypothetical protein n=1 Tax=Pseudonocardia alni TaxID=33907 RepID=UPI0036BA6258